MEEVDSSVGVGVGDGEGEGEGEGSGGNPTMGPIVAPVS